MVPTLSSGGAERVVSILASCLAEDGKDIYLIIHRHARLEYEISDKVNVLYLDDGEYSSNKILGRIQRLLAVRKYVKENRIDYIVPFLDSCIIHSYISTRGTSCKFITTLRNNPYERTRSERTLCDCIALLADANFVQNKMQKDYFSKRIQRKTFIVPNPVNPRFFESHKEYRDKITQLVAIGRLNPQKNYPRLIDAVCLVRQSHPDIRLKIYGEGGLQDDIAELIRKKNATDYISLEGRTSDVIGALGDSDLYIMSSDYEGMPNALMEAMAFGMPCVSTDCPTGPAELIGENERGYLADMKSLQSLQDAISYMIDNPAKAKEAGVAAREYMMNGFSAKEISARFYRECTKY